MKTPVRPRFKLLAGAIISITLVGSAAALAQVGNPPPAIPSPVPAPVVAPVVPTAPAQNPGAVAAIEQSAVATPQPAGQNQPTIQPSAAVREQASAAVQYDVPPAGAGIFEGSSQRLREFAYLETEVQLNDKRKARLDSMSALKEAERNFVDQLSGRTASAAPGAAPGGAAAPAVAITPPKPEPYVNSVYGFGDDMYAEIVIGSTKVLASRGTVLSDGSRVSAISSSSVTLSRRGSTKRLLVRGAAGY